MDEFLLIFTPDKLSVIKLNFEEQMKLTSLREVLFLVLVHTALIGLGV